MSDQFNCKKCKKQFRPDEQKITIKQNVKIIKCPFCGKKYENIKYARGYIRLSSGQLVRRKKKEKMSKKERLRRRKANENSK